jgi:polysaccharide chain length determinant protein (PEP-CTERM system associated)
MKEIFDLVTAQVCGAWRFRWIAVAVCWSIAAIGWTAVWLLPNSYEAHTRVYVDTDTVLRPLLAGLAVGTDLNSEVNAVSNLILSRPNLLKVAHETGLDQRASNNEQLDLLVERLRRQITLTSGRDGTWNIAYADYDQQTATRVVDTLLHSFVGNVLGNKRDDQDAASGFLQQQIKEYEQRLQGAEERLAEFKRSNVGQMPNETGDYYARLQRALADAEVLRGKYRQLTEKRNAIARGLEGEEPTFGIVSPNGSSADPKIAALRARLDQLLVQYTDKHPEVIALKETIASLEAERKQRSGNDQAAAEQMDPSKLALRALDMNPVYQSMKISLSQAEAELAEVHSQMDDADRSVAELRAKVNVIPEVEARLAQLNRDYEVNRAQYTQLVQRLESARISREAEQSTERAKFRVIEPPRVSPQPVSPRRIVLLPLVLAASLAGGIGLALVLNQVWPVFSTRRAVEHALGIPVLGAIRLVHGSMEDSAVRRQPLVLITTFALLLAVFIGNMIAV